MLQRIQEIIIEEMGTKDLIYKEEESSRTKMIFYAKKKNTNLIELDYSHTLDFIIYESENNEGDAKVFRCASIVPSIAAGINRLFGKNSSFYLGMITSEILKEVKVLVNECVSLSSTVNNPFVDVFRQVFLGTMISKYLTPKEFLSLERLNSTMKHCLNSGIARNYWMFALRRDFNVIDNGPDPLENYKLNHRRMLADRAAAERQNRVNPAVQELLDQVRGIRPVYQHINHIRDPLNPFEINPFEMNPFRDPGADLHHPGIRRPNYNMYPNIRGDPRNFGGPNYDNNGGGPGAFFNRDDII
uniref:PI31_Prot_N domain-containing protein n=1 Tax=Parastrongyloides trichosuri TaxID=131310 RepID=A0A0N5A017_PARTI